jgi:hypothetical protein
LVEKIKKILHTGVFTPQTPVRQQKFATSLRERAVKAKFMAYGTNLHINTL